MSFAAIYEVQKYVKIKRFRGFALDPTMGASVLPRPLRGCKEPHYKHSALRVRSFGPSGLNT